MFFNYIRRNISTLFVEKVEIATIFLHDFIFGGNFHQIDKDFHFMRIVFILVEITTSFHQKLPLKQGRYGWLRTKNLQFRVDEIQNFVIY